MNIRFRAFAPKDWAWVKAQVNVLQVADTSGIMAIDTETMQPVGACIFDNWTENSVQGHFMLTTPLVIRHGFLEEIYGYIFNWCNKKYIYALIPGDNEKSLKLMQHGGFTEHCRMPEAWADGVDYVLVELKKENCTHLPIEEAA